MKTWTKEELAKALQEIRSRGWVRNTRKGNDGSVGNILEDLLGIEENNLPIPNATEWELKCQRVKTKSLTTLFHMEPSPRAIKFVPAVLLPQYGWPSKEAGKKYPKDEMSFRQTINGLDRSDRGFGVVINHKDRKVIVSFDSATVSKEHKEWLSFVEEKVGLSELNPQPYWGFDDLFHKAGTKLINCFYVKAEVKVENKIEYFQYSKIMMLQQFSLPKFLKVIEEGNIYVDFDARTGHNHGTKFRLRQNAFASLYEKCIEL